jgi:hypothetical protein
VNNELSPEERHKIFLEEKARLEIRQELEGPKKSVGVIVGYVCLAVLGIIFVAAMAGKIMNLVDASNAAQRRAPDHASGQSSEASGQSSVAITTVRSSWYCSPGSEDSAVQLNLAIARKDMLAAAGHVSRNGAFELGTGTAIDVVREGASSLVLVRVTSDVLKAP